MKIILQWKDQVGKQRSSIMNYFVLFQFFFILFSFVFIVHIHCIHTPLTFIYRFIIINDDDENILKDISIFQKSFIDPRHIYFNMSHQVLSVLVFFKETKKCVYIAIHEEIVYVEVLMIIGREENWEYLLSSYWFFVFVDW